MNPSYYGLSEADMDTTFFTGSLVGGVRMTLREILQRLRRIYCSTVGAEYMYINSVPHQTLDTGAPGRAGGRDSIIPTRSRSAFSNG